MHQGIVNELRTLAQLAESIWARLADIRRAEALGRFAIGDEVHAVRYGQGAAVCSVRQLSERTGLDESGLRRLGRTSEGIRPEHRNAILSLTDSRGFPLSWSHLEELARVRNSERQIGVARKALAERFSAEDLRRYISGRDTVSQSVA
jgi:hypothetical protein